jgi:peptidyl-prolyl cis-trans isomerase C
MTRWLSAALLVLATGAAAQGYNPGVAARVNGVAISNQTFDRSYREYLIDKRVNIVTTRDPQKLTTLRREALELLIHRELARQQAHKVGVTANAEETEAAFNELRDAFETSEAFARKLEAEGFTEDGYREHLAGVLSARKYIDRVRAAVPAVSDAELEAFYRDNPRRLTLPEQVRARQILLRLKPNASEEQKQAIRARLETLREQALDGADFAELAKAHSEAGNAATGGDLGWFFRGQEFKPVEDAAFGLEPGEVSGVVPALNGLCIVRLEARQAARLLLLDEIRDQLRDYLFQQNLEQVVKDELERLYSSADIEILAGGIKPRPER